MTKTLLLPASDPRQLRHLSNQLDLPKIRTREDVITALFHFPNNDMLDMLPDTEEQRDALDHVKAHFKLVAMWLEYRLLDKHHFREALHRHPDALKVKAYADLSVATLDFCSHAFSRLQPAGVDNFIELWGMCEISRALAALRSTGYYGDVIPQSNSQMHKGMIKALDAFSQLEEGSLSEQLVTNFEPREHLTEMLLQDAIEFANVEPEDKDLNFHIRKYKSAWRHYSDLTLHRHKGFNPVQINPSKPEKPRGRGRPPKGSSRKSTA